MAGLAFSEIMPFLSLYVDTLGQFTKDQLNLYSGITFSATYLVTAIASPIWGKLADSKGRIDAPARLARYGNRHGTHGCRHERLGTHGIAIYSGDFLRLH